MAENDKKRGRGGKRFTKSYQPANEAKQVKKGKTIIKEAIGLDSWESVQNYLLTEGAAKFIQSLHSLADKNFVFTYLQAMEYFKPKLSRAEVTGKDGTPLPAPIINVIARKAD